MSGADPPALRRGASRPAGRRRPLVIAHRGASGWRPENTPSAYALAVEQGADMLEIDLHRTRDGTLVVTHDEHLRGLGGQAALADATLAEVRALDAGDGQPVPTLDEVLDTFGPQIAFNLELKRGTRGDYPGLEAAALAAVESRDLLERTLFSSFYDTMLRRLRELSPRARIGVLLSRRERGRAIERARAVGAEAIHPPAALAAPELVQEAHAAGLAVHVYTVDEPAEMERLVSLGVDGLFTNFPDRLLAVLAARAGAAGPGTG